MIKIFNANDRDFSTAGNIIIKPIKCNEIKKKSLNGWYIEVEVPIKYKDYISKDKLCVVKTKSKLNPQAFRIGEEINYTTRKIKFKAEHVMFDAKDYALLDVRPTNQNGLNALNYINERTDSVSPFTMYSNVENINTAYFIRKNLLEAWTIIEERWGGVFDADNWNISFLTSVGNDNGETIAYGKNMQGFDIFEDWSSVCTKLCPVGYDGLMLPEQFLTSDVQYEKQYTRIIDFQTDLEGEEQTEENLLAELRKKAEAYLEENKVPKVSYTIVSNINGNLEIGDTIKVLHPFVNIFTEVLEYEYNLISEKVVSLTFGNYSRDVKTKFENIKNTIKQVNQAISKQEVVINNQTNLINSLNKNGYVYIDENEILLLDAIPKEKAKNVWRFGLAGIGFSSNGYEGPFEVAITMDGQINANFITTGTMSVSRIEGLANFISETEKQISEIEIEQGNITSRVSSLETTAESLQAQIDGAIQFWNGSEIPTVENYPANEWTTEADRNNHRADIYTVIQDIDGELKQGKSYRFDKVGNTWQWIELTDNELSAVQALATSKAKVFVETPTVPYSVGDLWLNNGKLCRCKTAKDSNGSYSSSDWEIAVDYTDDTVAELAKTLANNAQSTADSAIEGVNNITNTQGEAEGKNIHIEDSAEEPFVEVKLYGETSQKTREGYNIFYVNKNDIQQNSWLSYDEKKETFTIKQGTGIAPIPIPINTSLEIGSTITVSFIMLSGKYTSGLISLGTYHINPNSWQGKIDLPKNENLKDKIFSDTVSITDEINGFMPFIYSNPTIEEDIVFKVQLTKSSELKPYEPYGVMPSPDYPSEIENLEGRNKFNKAVNYIQLYMDTNSIITSTNDYIGYIKCKPNTKYSISKPKTYAQSFYIGSTNVFPSNNVNVINGVVSSNPTKYENYITPENAEYLVFRIGPEGNGITLKEMLDNIQVEEGSVATPYVPYNSLEFKVEGKNILPKNKIKTTSDFFSRNEDGTYKIIAGTPTKSQYHTEEPFYLPAGTYTFCVNKQLELGVQIYLQNLTDNSYAIGLFTTTSSKTFTFTEGKIVQINTATVLNYTFTGTDDIIIQLEKGEKTTDSEIHKSQVVYFPLGEGEKLYQGSFLDDNGKNHERKQTILGDITSLNSATLFSVECKFAIYSLPNAKNVGRSYNFMSDRISPANETFGQYKGYRNGTSLYVLTTADDTVENFNSKINGSIVEYDLAEPETVPYTEEQQEAWNKIKALMTYKNITNITSDAYAKVTYMRDNGLDVYETKQNAQKRYTETSEKLAEQKMTVDGVITQVSETNKRLTNDYLTAEQVNAELDTTKEDIEIIKQNQVTMTQTSKNLQIAIDTINNEGVTKVKTSMGYTFDDEGFKLNRSNARTGTIIDEAAVQVIDKTGASKQNLLYAGYVKEDNTNYPSYIGQTVVASANMIIQNYLVVPNSRFEEYTNPVLGGKGTGVFEI